MAEKLAVVTGASGGIGSEICKHLAARGIHLILVDRSHSKMTRFVDSLDATSRSRIRGMYPVDLSNRLDVARLCGAILSNYPAIDYLFNNAGVLTESLMFASNGNELHFEVNALAPLEIIDHLRPGLRSAKTSVVVNTTAGLSLRAKSLDVDELRNPKSFEKLFGPYVNSKAALNVLTAALAVELAPDGIAVIAVDPGPTRTVLTKGAGTPAWMRLFYIFLPSPAKSAAKIVDAAMSSRWQNSSGVMISGGAVKKQPGSLGKYDFQESFLRQCRQFLRSM